MNSVLPDTSHHPLHPRATEDAVGVCRHGRGQEPRIGCRQPRPAPRMARFGPSRPRETSVSRSANDPRPPLLPRLACHRLGSLFLALVLLAVRGGRAARSTTS